VRIVYEVDNNRRRFLDAEVSVREVSVGEGSLVVEKEDICYGILWTLTFFFFFYLFFLILYFFFFLVMMKRHMTSQSHDISHDVTS